MPSPALYWCSLGGVRPSGRLKCLCLCFYLTVRVHRVKLCHIQALIDAARNGLYVRHQLVLNGLQVKTILSGNEIDCQTQMSKPSYKLNTATVKLYTLNKSCYNYLEHIKNYNLQNIKVVIIICKIICFT